MLHLVRGLFERKWNEDRFSVVACAATQQPFALLITVAYPRYPILSYLSTQQNELKIL